VPDFVQQSMMNFMVTDKERHSHKNVCWEGSWERIGVVGYIRTVIKQGLNEKSLEGRKAPSSVLRPPSMFSRIQSSRAKCPSAPPILPLVG